MLKIERYLFYIFLFLVPFQLRDFWHWAGNEWNSVFFYVTDGLFLLVLVLWIARKLQMPKSKLFQIKSKIQTNLLLIIFLIIAGTSLLVSSNLEIGFFRFVKLLEFILLYIYIRGNTGFLRIKNIFLVLIVSGVVQSVLAIGQFLKQSSLGLKFVEAGVFKPGEPGVATFIMENGEKIMRAYGSFPHPNVLAAFLLLGIFCLYYLFLMKKFNLLLITCYLLLVFSLFLTFSRTVIVVFVVVSLVMFLCYIIRIRDFRSPGLRKSESRTLILVFAVFIFSVIISTAILFPYLRDRFFTISLEEQAVDLRFFYNKMAIQMIKEKPLLGIGIGNFVWHSQNYPAYFRAASKMVGSSTIPSWVYQPVHNIYLLIAVEMGILGLIVFIAMLITNCIRMIRKVNPFFFLLIGFLVMGLADHYFWTLQSGGIIFWLALGLASDKLK